MEILFVLLFVAVATSLITGRKFLGRRSLRFNPSAVLAPPSNQMLQEPLRTTAPCRDGVFVFHVEAALVWHGFGTRGEIEDRVQDVMSHIGQQVSRRISDVCRTFDRTQDREVEETLRADFPTSVRVEGTGLEYQLFVHVRRDQGLVEQARKADLAWLDQAAEQRRELMKVEHDQARAAKLRQMLQLVTEKDRLLGPSEPTHLDGYRLIERVEKTSEVLERLRGDDPGTAGLREMYRGVIEQARSLDVFEFMERQQPMLHEVMRQLGIEEPVEEASEPAGSAVP